MKALFLLCLICLSGLAFSQPNVRIKKKDRKRDIALVTSEGTIVLRLSDSTPVHRDNFLSMVKTRYYDSMLFHRVISGFMIQTGDPASKQSVEGKAYGSSGASHTIPAEFKSHLFHKKGALAAARMGDDVNPQKRSSGSHFYIVQGKIFSDLQLDSIEQVRLKGYKLPADHRYVYKTVGGTPQLDQQYTVFGEVVRGLEVVDRIAGAVTNRALNDRPQKDIRIVKVKLVRRK